MEVVMSDTRKKGLFDSAHTKHHYGTRKTSEYIRKHCLLPDYCQEVKDMVR